MNKELIARFEEAAERDGLDTTPSASNGRRYVWDQTEWRWLGFLMAQQLQAPVVTAAARDVLAERARQVSEEGYTSEHDDGHPPYRLACAAGCYAMDTLAYPAGDPPPAWPWDWVWWKPRGMRSNLIKAGALILAEIERFDRAAASSTDE
jgi:hypothetical protein